jgi:catalase (peroxidase I)
MIGPVQTPILLRLAFHDAGTYNAATGTGGANASVRFELARVHNRSTVRRTGWPLIERVCTARMQHV